MLITYRLLFVLFLVDYVVDITRNDKPSDFIDQIESEAYALYGEEAVDQNGFKGIVRAKGVSNRFSIGPKPSFFSCN